MTDQKPLKALVEADIVGADLHRDQFGRSAGQVRGVEFIGIDGFVCTAAVAPLAKLQADGLAHALAAHASAEAAHRALLSELGLRPLMDLGMRLGEASGAAVGTLILRAAVACHTGMATFAQAGVAGKH